MAAAKQVGWALVALVLVSLLVFLSTHLLPGDAAQSILGREATPERVEALRVQLHLNEPLVRQYWVWASSLIHFDLGTSLSTSRPVAEMFKQRLGNTLILMVGAAVIGIPIALAIGIIAAYSRDGLFDNASALGTLVVAALPEFVIATLAVVLLSTGAWRLLPATSSNTPILAHPIQLILPCLSLALAIMPYVIRMMRGAMIEVFESDYIQHVRLSGIAERVVVGRHAFRNSVGAVTQVVALQLAYLAGGVVVVEYVFGYPGIGTLLVDAVNNRDLPVIQSVCLFIAAFYIVVNLIADGVAAMADPRVRTGRS